MKWLITFLLSLTTLFLEAQIVNQQAEFNYPKEAESYSFGSKEYTAFKPSFVPADSLANGLFKGRSKKSEFLLNPAFEILNGIQNGEKPSVYSYMLGADLKFKRGNHWNAGFTYLRNFSSNMNYQQKFINQNGVLPGTNVVSVNAEGMAIADYFSGFVNYKANSIFDFELGYGRNFIGDGYRSLLLSDFANASPYFKINTSFWKLKYTNIFAAHQDIFQVEGEQSLYQKKYSATHFLEWNATKWLSVGLFETIVWQAEEENYTRGFDVNYLNPVIFYRPVEFSVGSSDNALVGANLKITPFKQHVVYFQVLFDEFLLKEIRADIDQAQNPDEDIQSGWWANKYGFQIGWKAYNVFGIEGLKPQVEFNYVRPYTYAHSSRVQAYSNYNLSLAHPLGANFYEFISMLDYQKNRFSYHLQYNQNKKGYSQSFENLGENLQLSNKTRTKEYENFTTQGILHQVRYLSASVDYTLVEDWRAVVSLGYIWREEKIGSKTDINNMIYFSFKTKLFNRYFDY